MDSSQWQGCYQPAMEFLDEEEYDVNPMNEIEHNLSQMPPLSPDLVIPDTQPPTTQRRGGRSGGRGGARGSGRGGARGGGRGGESPEQDIRPRRQVTPWTKEEKIALCRAWVEVSEDRKAANYQKAKVFWRRIRDLFYEQVGSKTRSTDMISGRWADIRKYVGLFTNLHNRNAARVRASGSSDLDVYQFTCDEQKEEVLRKYRINKTWDEDYLWRILRNCSKWVELISIEDMSEGGSSSKRAKMSSSRGYVSSASSDAHMGIDLNSDEGLPPSLLGRPAGRDKAKAKQTANESDTEFSGEISKIRTPIEMTTKAKVDKNRMRKMDFFAKDFSHIPMPRRKILELEQARIVKEFEEELNINEE